MPVHIISPRSQIFVRSHAFGRLDQLFALLSLTVMGLFRTVLIAGAALLAAKLFFDGKGNTEYPDQGDYSHEAGRCQCAVCERDRERQAAQHARPPRSLFAARPPSSLDKLSPVPNTSRYGNPRQSAYATTKSQYRDDLDAAGDYICACGQIDYSNQSYGYSDDDQGTDVQRRNVAERFRDDGQRYSPLGHRPLSTESHSSIRFSYSHAFVEDQHESYSDDWNETGEHLTCNKGH